MLLGLVSDTEDAAIAVCVVSNRVVEVVAVVAITEKIGE